MPIPTTDRERSAGAEPGAKWVDVERDLPRNFAALLVHGLLGQTGSAW